MTTAKMVAEVRLPAQTESLSEVRAFIREATQRAGCGGDLTDNVVLAVNEACMNVIQHAYQFAGDQEMLLRVLQEHDLLIIELLDHASPVRPETVKSRDLEDIRPGGLGVHFIRTIMDEMTFTEPPPGFGNLLRMVKRINQGKPHGT